MVGARLRPRRQGILDFPGTLDALLPGEVEGARAGTQRGVGGVSRHKQRLVHGHPPLPQHLCKRAQQPLRLTLLLSHTKQSFNIVTVSQCLDTTMARW